MKCYYHIDREAVAACKQCERYLCKECADKYTPILCDGCYTILREETTSDTAGSPGRQ